MPALGRQVNTISIGNADPFARDDQQFFYTTMTDGYKIAIYQTAGGGLYWRSISPTGVLGTETKIAGGGLGSSTPTIYAAFNLNDGVQVDVNSIYIFGAKVANYDGQPNMWLGYVFLFWNASTHAMNTALYYLMPEATNGQNGGRTGIVLYNQGLGWNPTSIDALWNSTYSVLYLILTMDAGPILLQCGGVNFASCYYINAFVGNNTVYEAHIDAASASSSQILLSFADRRDGGRLTIAPFAPAASGTLPTFSAYETVDLAPQAWSIAFDASGNADVVYENPTTTALWTKKRLGPSYYSASVELVSSTCPTTWDASGRPALSHNSSNDDLWIFFETLDPVQRFTEIAFLKRHSGVWDANPTVLIGEDSLGYTNASVNPVVNASGNTEILYVAGGATFYLSAGASAPPYQPVGISPAAATWTTTPSFSFTAPNPLGSTDPQGAYEILVTRASDGSSFWDSGIVSSSAMSGISYAGTALVDDIDYLWSVRSRDSVGSTWSPYSVPIRFTPRSPLYGGIGAITPAGGSRTTGAAASTLNGATLANATSLVTQTGQGSRFTNGQQIAVGLTPNIDIVTIGTLSGDTLPVSTMAYAHSNGDPVVELNSVVAALTAPTFTLDIEVTQGQGHALNAYQLELYASDGLTLLTSTALIPSTAASGTLFTTASVAWQAYMLNGGTYKLGVVVVDGTTGASWASPLWTVTLAEIVPGTVTGLTPTISSAAGTIALAWTNGSNTASNNLYYRENGDTAWTLIPAGSGTLRTTATIWGPLTIGQDYAVSGVSVYGVEGSLAVLSNQVIPVRWGTYGVWLNQLPDPDNYVATIGNLAAVQAALGLIDGTDWQNASLWADIEDELSVVPVGRSEPTTNFGKTDYAEAVGRKYYLIDDTQAGVTVTARSVIKALRQMRGVNNNFGCLYRDFRGDLRYVQMTLFTKEVADAVGNITTMTLREFSYDLGIPVL